MNQKVRTIIAFIVLAGILLLAGNRIAWAGGGVAREANQSALAALTGFVWHDANQDGVQDKKEMGVANVVVNLYDAAKVLVNTAITDETGHYHFESLVPGDYYVHLEELQGYVISPQNNSKDEALDSDADILTGETIPATLAAGENVLKWDIGLYKPGVPPPPPGTVKPPPGEITLCEDDIESIGGVATLTVKDLAPGYCLVAFLRNHAFAVGRIPDGAGGVLAHITFVRVFYYGKLVSEVPTQDGSVKICYALVPGKTAQIYFFDFYGPQFGERTGQPSWEPLETTVDGGRACAVAQTTGAYALIGK